MLPRPIFFHRREKKMNEYSHFTFSSGLKCIMHDILVFKNNHLVRVQWQSEVNSVNRDNLRGKNILHPLEYHFIWMLLIFTCCFFGSAPWNDIMKSKIPHTENSSLLTAHRRQVLMFSDMVPISTLYFMYIKCISRSFLLNSTGTEKPGSPYV